MKSLVQRRRAATCGGGRGGPGACQRRGGVTCYGVRGPVYSAVVLSLAMEAAAGPEYSAVLLPNAMEAAGPGTAQLSSPLLWRLWPTDFVVAAVEAPRALRGPTKFTACCSTAAQHAGPRPQ